MEEVEHLSKKKNCSKKYNEVVQAFPNLNIEIVPKLEYTSLALTYM